MAGFADGSAPPMHCARATLPARVATLLAHEPQLVASAVDAFYNRDLDAMKASATSLMHVQPGQGNSSLCLPAHDPASSPLHMVPLEAHGVHA